MVGLFASNLILAIGVVYVTHLNRKSFDALNKLEQMRDELNIEWGQLQLEQSTFASHGKLESMARERLKMKLPMAGDMEILR